MIESSGGVFEIILDGEIVFTNNDRRGFIPEAQEVIDLLNLRLSPADPSP